MTCEDIFAVLVVCNAAVEKSLTYRSIAASGVRLVVCDNSTEDFGNAAFCESMPNVRYIDMGGNLGLPKAYNAALDWLGGREGLVCLFDDDTQIPSEYFPLLCGAAQREADFDIFVPLVYDEVGLLSPNLIRGTRIRRAGSLSGLGGDIGAINSAMAIRTEVFRGFRYDENLFLDFVDYAFLREMKRQGRRIFILENVSLRQSFSANTDSEEKAAARFKIFQKDAKYYFRDTPLASRRAILRRRLSLCRKFRTLKFLFR